MVSYRDEKIHFYAYVPIRLLFDKSWIYDQL